MIQLQAKSDAIEQYFQLSLYLLVVTGFVTLATTGKLDAPALLLVSLALLYRGYLLIRGRVLQLPERWTSYLTVLYAAFYLCDLFLLSGSFVPASVHLVLFIMVVKVFSVQRDRDHVYLAVIAFLSVLAAAVLTVDAVFFASFCVFLLLAASTFISMEMRRSAAGAAGTFRVVLNDRQRLAGSLFTTAFAIALCTALGSAMIFFIMPRISAGYLSAYAQRNALVSGFSDEVRLGEIGQIQQSNTVVMRIQIEGEASGVQDLKWRGLALQNFDGVRWSNPPQTVTAIPDSEGTFDLSATKAATAITVQHRLLRYRVLMEPIGDGIFFLPPQPRTLSGNYPMVTVDEGGAVYNGDREHPIGSYRGVSDLGQLSAEELRRAPPEVTPEITSRYLQLPTLDPRVAQLAREITAGAPSRYDQVQAIEDYLQRHYTYTLQLPASPERDPMAYFLFERKAGHCEYFASAMALMLRTVGIPARVVNGFRGAEFNSVSGSYIVRGKDAHSWIEAYFPGYGWIGFDPTPPGAAAVPGTWNRAGLYVDALREFWREWVVNYDFSHQMSLSNNVAAHSRQGLDATRKWMRQKYESLLVRARNLQDRAAKSVWSTGGAVLGIVAVAVLLLNIGRLRRELEAWRSMRNPGRAPQAAASMWYARMLQVLRRRGWRKPPEHTPKEFARSIADPRLRRPVELFTDHYEHARFGNSAPDAQALPEIYEEIRNS